MIKVARSHCYSYGLFIRSLAYVKLIGLFMKALVDMQGARVSTVASSISYPLYPELLLDLTDSKMRLVKLSDTFTLLSF